MPSLLCCRGLLVDLLEELSGCSDAPEALPRGPGALLQQIPLPQVGRSAQPRVGLRFCTAEFPLGIACLTQPGVWGIGALPCSWRACI